MEPSDVRAAIESAGWPPTRRCAKLLRMAASHPRSHAAARSVALVLGVTIGVAGCYASHAREVPVDPDACAPVGRHTVAERVTRTTAGCGMVGSIGDLDVSIPPTEATFRGAGAIDIVMTGPCRWDVHAESAIPDLSSVLDGTIDTSDGTVRGTFDVVVVGIAGTSCESTLEWTERE